MPHNLPIQLTSFIGREREIAQVQAFLSRARLLTLTGTGGVGKTRLALQVAAKALDDFRDGVWVVDFAPLADPALAPQTVASVLGLSEQPGRPLIDTLADFLRPKSLLLVLDNCEHVRAACAVHATTLLRECLTLRILVTSRAPLNIAGEVLWRVPSLSLPDPGRLPQLEPGAGSEAVRFLVERAQMAQPAFVLTSDNAPAVLKVCRTLDGIPLALELAAARTRVLTIEQIAARLDDRFRLLTGGSPSLLPRHQTLQATMDWSYGLLPDEARHLLRRLSVFAGGWSLEAAEAVCAGDGIEAADILDMLTKLVDNSLVMVEALGGQARYRLLETVRQYSLDRLVQSAETEAVRARHGTCYLGLAERADSELRGPQQLAWLETLERENDNLRAALEWSTTHPRGDGAGLRLAGALTWFWYLHGYWSEGRRWLGQALALGAAAAPPSILPKALQGATYLAWRQSDLAEANALGERCLSLCHELGDRQNQAWVLIWLGIVAALEGEYGRGAKRLEEALTISRALSDAWLTGLALANLGVSARDQGDYERAVALHVESLALCRDLEDRFMIAYSLRNLGKDTLRQGNHERAEAHFSESLRLCLELKDRWVSAECLEGLAGVANASRSFQRAATLWGAAAALRETIGHRHFAVNQADYGQRLACTRAVLTEAAFGAAWAEGHTMTLDEAIRFALGLKAPTPVSAGLEMLKKRTVVELLTAREREVAALVAQGMTNRQIAAQLVVTERTAETHVQNILNKLGFTSRAQVAAWAVEQGLKLAYRP